MKSHESGNDHSPRLLSMALALALLPGLSLANPNNSLPNNPTNIQLAKHGHHGGHHGVWHGGHHGKWHGGWHGGLRFYWSPWVIYGPGVYFNPNKCVKRCYWHHGYKKCKVRCRRYW
ncbi:hypothetical protein [Legionella sp. W05-934-2]|jgi:hypothetical protein|uniref:hypothetical protein n=1 Tax=Legionella sp. W05-934-2 TaxID=1198649 RepID=UPI003462CEC1